MDSILKGLADVLLVGGTIGGYAMISVILIVVGYFKYFKPFLTEFYDLRGAIEDFQASHEIQNTELVELHRLLVDTNELISKKGDDMVMAVQADHEAYHKELRNLIDLVEKELLVVLDRTEKITSKNDNSHREVMIEIARLQTRLEYMNPSVARGIQK